MLRKTLFTLIMIMVVVGGIAFMPSSVEAQSAGCSSVAGLTGFLSETFTVSTGSQAFLTGDVITVTSPAAVDFSVSGSASYGSTGTSASYTIPADGNYTISVTNNTTMDTTIVASCAGVTGSGGAGVYNHFFFGIYDLGNGIYEVWGDCINTNECQLVARVDLNRIHEQSRFQDYGGSWYVDIFNIGNQGRLVTFQFNVYSSGNLLDDNFTVQHVVPSVVPDTTNPNIPDTLSEEAFSDTDGDGVLDDFDECPLLSGLPFLNGCRPGALSQEGPVLTLPGEDISAEGQCFNIFIFARAPQDIIPDRDTPPHEFPTFGGRFSVLSVEGNVLDIFDWSSQMFLGGELLYKEQITLPENLPFVANLTVTVDADIAEGEEAFVIEFARLTLLRPDCSNFSDSSALFDYVNQTGAYDDIVVSAQDDEESCSSLVSGVPILSSNC